ncbi:MAG: DNA repair protein RecO [Acidimicrobiales bacterium]|nr:DNA repair protein RecO [Acidimicrobiales bacterium]
MSLYRDDGVVLRTWRLGEADRIVVLLTAEHGKVRAVAKGVRKTRSKFGGRLEPTSHVAVQLHRGRGDLDIVTQAETLDRFEGLRLDAERFADASSLLEAVDVVALDRDPDRDRYQMLVGGLRTLEEHPAALVVPAFLLKLLAHEGLGPELEVCVRCGIDGPMVAVDIGEGGVLCQGCRSGRSVSTAAIAVMRAVLGGGLSKALAVTDPSVCAEVDAVVTSAAEYHMERRLRSRRVLDGA